MQRVQAREKEVQREKDVRAVARQLFRAIQRARIDARGKVLQVLEQLQAEKAEPEEQRDAERDQDAATRAAPRRVHRPGGGETRRYQDGSIDGADGDVVVMYGPGKVVRVLEAIAGIQPEECTKQQHLAGEKE